MKLVLFDIDGTLLDAQKAGADSFLRFFEDVFGAHEEPPNIRFAGNTDLNIVQQLVAERGEPMCEDRLSRFFEGLPGILEEELQARKPLIIPGCADLIHRLNESPHHLLGLVTGNIEGCARVKLNSVDLDPFFPFGGFGCDHPDRNEMAKLAVRRAEEYIPAGDELEQCYLVGDTPHDMEAAREVSACAIGMATGHYSEDGLRTAGADAVFPDYTDQTAWAQLLGLDMDERS